MPTRIVCCLSLLGLFGMTACLPVPYFVPPLKVHGELGEAAGNLRPADASSAEEGNLSAPDTLRVSLQPMQWAWLVWGLEEGDGDRLVLSDVAPYLEMFDVGFGYHWSDDASKSDVAVQTRGPFIESTVWAWESDGLEYYVDPEVHGVVRRGWRFGLSGRLEGLASSGAVEGEDTGLGYGFGVSLEYVAGALEFFRHGDLSGERRTRSVHREQLDPITGMKRPIREEVDDEPSVFPALGVGARAGDWAIGFELMGSRRAMRYQDYWMVNLGLNIRIPTIFGLYLLPLL